MVNNNSKNPLVLSLRVIDKTQLNTVGGKGANLGEIARIEGIHVPDGFCITTEAFKRIAGETPSVKELLDQLSILNVDDRDKIVEISSEIRCAIEAIDIPRDIDKEIVHHISMLGENNAWAVRSSATAEDLPTASFAGQQDTFLNIIGKDAILKHISKCWASLFTDRAVIYRIQNGFDHRKVLLSVVVQKMIFPKVSGIVFTADPVTSNRKVLSIDAGFGLGEALVSGLVNPDIYKVRNGIITGKKISAKKLAVYALNDGGTKEQELEPEKQNIQALTDEQILQLELIGRKIEAHFDSPQDIEWCMADDTLYIVQSRPITTLFPIPERDDQAWHVYLSVGHQQMMTNPLKPLGLSIFQQSAIGTMFKAGGRLFVDVAPILSSPDKREHFINTIGQHDPLMKDALVNIMEQGDLINSPTDGELPPSVKSSNIASPDHFQPIVENDPAIPSNLIERSRAEIEELKQNIQSKSGPDLFEFILEEMQKSKQFLTNPQSFGVFMSAMNAASWLNDKMNEWLGEKNVADVISLSVPNNITSEMGLALLDVSDAIRPYPEVIEYLHRVKDDSFPDEMIKIDGGKQSRDAINAYLKKYGMRCTGEIDITNPRWSEKPTTLLPMILSNIKNFEPGESNRKFEQGLQEALKKEEELIERLKQLPGGEEKALETKRVISIIRNFIGYREYPKYDLINRFFVFKQALLKEAERLVEANLIHEKEDIFYLTFEEFGEAVRTNKLDYKIINQRKDEHKLFEKMTPPRVITSDGEIGAGKYKRGNLPENALVGLAVSSGIIEGRARVIQNLHDAVLEEGDILVASFTDPAWTALFVSIKGLVTEVGGLNTHGAVIAREYGIPAVVGVENATRLIKDGQRIRVNGTEGYVEIL